MVEDRSHPSDSGAAAIGTGGRLAELAATIERQSYPPVHRWEPERSASIDMRIARDGTWYYRGSPIPRKSMVKLFSSVLRRDRDAYYLVTPAEKLQIQVDDAPYVAVELESEVRGGEQAIAFRTQTDEYVIADAEHPIYVITDPETGEPAPYVRVRDGLDALILRPVFYELVDMAERYRDGTRETLGVWSRASFFPLGSLEPGESG